MRLDRRGAFTLVEVTLALALAGFAIVGGMLLVDQVSNASSRVEREARRHGSNANGARLLKQLLLEASLSADTTSAFHGDSLTVAFSTRCFTSSGWSDPCRVSVSIDRQRDTSAVIASFATEESYPTLRIPGRAALRYVDATSNEASWFNQWSSTVELPSGVAVVSDGDTVVFPVGVVRE